MKLSTASSILTPVLKSIDLAPPAWVWRLLHRGNPREAPGPGGGMLVMSEGAEFSLVSITVPDARNLGGDEFEAVTAAAYLAIRQTLEHCSARSPIRVWNHLPQIHAPCTGGIDRYMAFNAGRFSAYSQWFGGAAAFDRTVPSASGVGHDGNDLVIHLLASRAPGRALANSRQVAPYHYSRRFGPQPPCFARATVIPGETTGSSRVLVGGTASIRGELSTHMGDLANQTTETFHNLAHLIRAAGINAADAAGEMTDAEVRRRLSTFANLRVYYLRNTDREAIQAGVEAAFAADCAIEYVRADLCRAELLIEIEGVAVV